MEIQRMHEFKIGEAAAVLGVSADTVRRLANARTLKTKRTRGGQRLVDGESLMTYLVERDRQPVESAASRQSMRNRLTGIVTRVVKDKVAAQVEIQVGAHRLVSLLTREAVDTLGLTPGMMAIATVKATNVSVELPPPASRGKRSG
jgi:molybdopterin-binding protein